MLFESLSNEPRVGIDDRAPQQLGISEPLTLDGVAYGIGMDPQFTGNGADFPMLSVKISSNLRAGFRTDHLLDLTFVVECVETD